MAAVTAAVIGATAAIAGTTMSFVQAGEQKKAQRQAEKDASEAMANARKKLETNFYAAQSIKKEPYELEREALLAQGAEAIQAGVESERGAAATAGRVQLAQQQGQAGVRTAMGQEITALENKQLAEQSRLNDIGVQLDLGQVEGAQLAAANAQKLGAQAMQQGFQGLTSVGQQVASAVPLFAGTATPSVSTPNTISQPVITPSFTNSLRASTAVPATQNTIGMQTAATPPPIMPLYLQKQQDFRFYNNPYTYNDPFNIYGKRN